jgi:chaperonin GroEL (HSP60 family)
MAAKLATVDERVLAHARGSEDLRDAVVASAEASEGLRGRVLEFDCGYLSPFFITDPECMEVAFENVYILVYPGKISSKKDLLPLLEQITKDSKPLLIIAEDVEGEALATLVVSKLSGFLRVAAVSAPGLGDQRKSWLQDIAQLTGGKAIMEGLDTQLKNIQISDLGQAKKVTIDKNRTVIESAAIYNQLCTSVLLKSSPVADSGQHGKREYSQTSKPLFEEETNATRNDRPGTNGLEHGATADKSRSRVRSV